jgi:hypothetical protein
MTSTPLMVPSTPVAATDPSSVRVVFVGDSLVGKTMVVHTLAGCADPGRSPLPSIGVDYRHVRVTTLHDVLRLVLVDLPGQERYRAMTRMAFKHADVICLVYAADRPDTLASLKHTWLEKEVAQGIGVGVGGGGVDDTRRRRRPVQFVLVRIHHFASSVDYLAVQRLVQDIQDECVALSGGEEPEHVAVTMGPAWDVRKLSGAIVRAYTQVAARVAAGGLPDQSLHGDEDDDNHQHLERRALVPAHKRRHVEARARNPGVRRPWYCPAWATLLPRRLWQWLSGGGER